MRLLALLAFAPAALAQGQTPTIRGSVVDSLRHRPLAGAIVQLVRRADSGTGRSYSVVTDSAGAFQVSGVEPGDYAVGFFHPLLDSLSLEPAARPLRVGQESMSIALGSPSLRTLRAALCGAESDASALIFGTVRSVRQDQLATGAIVHANWIDLSPSGNWQRRTVDLPLTEEGKFFACGVPTQTTVWLRAEAGEASSGEIPLASDSATLYLVDVAVGPSEPVVDPGAQSPVFKGRARLMGRVIDEKGMPMAGAVVRVDGTGKAATTSSTGSFALDSLPEGSRLVEVAFIGRDRSVQVVQLADSDYSSRDLLVGQAVSRLPGISVIARSEGVLNDFERRMKSNVYSATFLGPEAVARKTNGTVGQLVLGTRGVERQCQQGQCVVAMIAPSSSRGEGSIPTRTLCAPAVFIDGIHARAYDEGNLDELLLRDVLAVEVYPRPAAVPIQYQMHRDTPCGAIVIWRKVAPGTLD